MNKFFLESKAASNVTCTILWSGYNFELVNKGDPSHSKAYHWKVSLQMWTLRTAFRSEEAISDQLLCMLFSSCTPTQAVLDFPPKGCALYLDSDPEGGRYYDKLGQWLEKCRRGLAGLADLEENKGSVITRYKRRFGTGTDQLHGVSLEFLS